MTHIAMQEVDELGSPVTWGEHVTEEEYSGGAIDRELNQPLFIAKRHSRFAR